MLRRYKLIANANFIIATGCEVIMFLSFDRDEEYKVVILVRQDLKLSKGKAAAQASHAAVACALQAEKKYPADFRAWEAGGSKISVLKIADERELFEFKEIAKANDIPCSVVCDAGRTEVEPGTFTCIGLGPKKQSELDRFTGDLKML
jgi:PTH2 family peptidyl-tRNA hydrolase